jgi:hypothetical protein
MAAFFLPFPHSKETPMTDPSPERVQRLLDRIEGAVKWLDEPLPPAAPLRPAGNRVRITDDEAAQLDRICRAAFDGDVAARVARWVAQAREDEDALSRGWLVPAPGREWLVATPPVLRGNVA